MPEHCWHCQRTCSVVTAEQERSLRTEQVGRAVLDLKDATHGVIVRFSGGAVCTQMANHSAASSLFSPLHFCVLCRGVKGLNKAKGNYSCTHVLESEQSQFTNH